MPSDAEIAVGGDIAKDIGGEGFDSYFDKYLGYYVKLKQAKAISKQGKANIASPAAPAASGPSNTTWYLIGGGALLLVLVVVLAGRKGR